jgi:hypothetical protein
VKKGHNGRKSPRRLKPTVGSNASKIIIIIIIIISHFTLSMEQTVFLGFVMLQLFGGCSHMAHVTSKAEDTVLQNTTLYYRLQITVITKTHIFWLYKAESIRPYV